MQNPLFICGIGTDVGKTVVSAILTEAINADYWKPVQAGDLNNTDTMKVRDWVSNKFSQFHPEVYKLKNAMSPHAAAEAEGINISFAEIKLPTTANKLIIEAAGGLMVPLNNEMLIIDLINKLEAKAVLVSKNYLGSINHTLLSVEALRSRGVKIIGIIFNGNRNKATEEYILNYTGLNCLLKIDDEQEINKDVIIKYSKQIDLSKII